MKKEDILTLAQFCKENLNFDNVKSGDEYGYANLPLCIIDAVFSIGVRYTGVQNTITRFCDFFDIVKFNSDGLPAPEAQLAVSTFLKMYSKHGVESMTNNVYQNKQRTSTANGILKSEAVLRFAEIVAKYGVEYLQDISKIQGNKEFETEIMKIPGQRSGISLRYFYMLAGSENLIKPDRMINRFIYTATEKSFSVEEATELLVATCQELTKEYPKLTPRTLDNIIWNYQRTR